MECVKCRVLVERGGVWWSVGCRVWSVVECGGVWGVECGVWRSVKCGVWSEESKV